MTTSHRRIIEMTAHMRRICEEIEAEARKHIQDEELSRVKELAGMDMEEAKKPSSGMTKGEKSSLVKQAKAGKDIGKPGKGFAKVEKQAAKYGARDPKAVAAAAMWKQAAKK